MKSGVTLRISVTKTGSIMSVMRMRTAWNTPIPVNTLLSICGRKLLVLAESGREEEKGSVSSRLGPSVKRFECHWDTVEFVHPLSVNPVERRSLSNRARESAWLCLAVLDLLLGSGTLFPPLTL